MRLICFFILSISSVSIAQEAPNDFVAGTSAYESKEYDKAREKFEPLLEANSENPALLYNLGLVYYQQGDFGRALGLWRKARSLDNSLTAVGAAISFVEEKLFPEAKTKPFFQTIFSWFLRRPFWLWAFLSLLSFFMGVWWALEYGVKRKLELNLWPNWVFLTLPVFLFSGSFTVYLTLQSLRIEATVIEKNLLTHTNPADTSPTIGELDEGQIVVIEKTYGHWAQIRTRAGAPGWVPKKTLIPFKGI